MSEKLLIYVYDVAHTDQVHAEDLMCTNSQRYYLHLLSKRS